MSDIHILETDLDLKQNLNIYTISKQLDTLHLVFNVYDDGLQADLTNYNVRLKALKSDKVPLIQDTDITVVSNVVKIIGDEQLTTTSGNTLIELEFINKTTGEKKATFNLNLKVVSGVLEVNRTISTATYTLLQELENKLDQASDFFEHIDEAIIANTNLTDNIEIGTPLNINLESNLAVATPLNSNLESNIETVNQLTSEINEANILATSNIEAMGSFGDVSVIAQTVAEHTTELSEIVQEQTTQNTNIGLKANSTDLETTNENLTSGLALKRDKTTLITTNDIDKSTDANKIHLLDLAEEVQSAMAGTTSVIATVADGSVTTEKYADNSITDSKVANGISISKMKRIIDNTDNRIAYNGIWLIDNKTYYSAGSASYSNRTNDYVEYIFEGTGVNIFSAKTQDSGIIEIFLDNVSQGIFDMYSSSALFKQKILSISNLVYELHALKIIIKSTKNSSSIDTTFYLDYFEVYGEKLAYQQDMEVIKSIIGFDETAIVDDSDNNISYIGTWDSSFHSLEYYNSTRHISNKTNDYMEYSFEGTGINIFGHAGIDCGIAEIFIDEVSQGIIDAYFPSAKDKQLLFSITNLTYGLHSLKIVVTGTKNASATDYYFVLDYFEILNPKLGSNSGIGLSLARIGLTPSTIIDNIENDIIYNGTWMLENNVGYYNGSASYSKANYMEYTFEGTGINVYSVKRGDCGIVEIFLDGITQGTFDMYNATRSFQEKIFSRKNLTYGTHTIKILIKGTKNASAQDYWFIFDYFEIINAKLNTDNNFILNAQLFGAKHDGVTDAIQSVINASALTGRRIFFPTGTYLINGQLTIPNYYGRQKPVHFIGDGAYMDGQGLGINGGTVFDMRYSGVAKLLTLGVGLLEIEGITFTDGGGSSTPFIYTTYTTLRIHGNSFIGSKDGILCDQDAIILGGTQEVEVRNQVSSDYGFQGYGTIIKDNYFNHIRRAVYGRVFANAVVVQNNTIWGGSGSNLADGACIEFDDCAANPVQYDAGGKISGNLIEMTNYPYGVKLLNAGFFALLANNLYDAGSGNTAIAGVYFGTLSKFNYLLVGFSSYEYGNMAEYEDHSDGTNMIVSPLTGIKTNANIQSSGYICKTPDGTKKYKLSVDNTGAIISTLVTQ